jgi:predicted DNA-binding transcriptional regulator AlpA
LLRSLAERAVTTTEILRRDRQRKKAKSEARVPRSTRLLRPKAIQAKLGIGHTKFWEDFVRTGRIKLVDIGPNAKGAPEDEVDDVIAEIIAERDAKLLSAKSEVE